MTMMEADVRKAELARRMGLHATQIDRMLNLFKSSRIEEIERAFRVLGKRLVVDVAREAA